MRYYLALFSLLAIAPLVHAAPPGTYYIDWVAGSNSNNGKSQGAAWKSVPGMQPVSGCAGATHTYAAVAGDQFIFKGGSGETWPAACFPIVPLGAGNSTVSDYWGACGGQSTAPAACAGATWPTSSWTRPVFDAQQTVINNFFRFDTEDYQIVDDIEMKNQKVTLAFGTQAAIQATPGGSISVVHVIVENAYIHDFMTSSTISNAAGSTWYSAGGIRGYVTLLNSTIDDSGGFGFNSSAVQVNGGMLGGACENCREVGFSKFVKNAASCFGVQLCHDNEITGINQNIISGPLPNFYNLNNTVGLHTQAIEDENAIGGFTVYNNAVHDNFAGINIFVGYCGSQVYNNVLWNNTNNSGIQFTSQTTGDSSGCRGYVYNNTVDSGGLGTIVAYNYSSHPSILGQIAITNNIVIGTTIANQLTGIVTISAQNRNPMTSGEASTYGFVAPNKYSPSSSDPNVSGQGVNLTSSCSGALAALCLDTSGAPWFGGSYKARPTGTCTSPPTGSCWDLGAYLGQGGTAGPPTSTLTAPSNGATISGSSVSLTATCTPVSPATCSSVQFFVNGAALGSPDTTAPYTGTLDSTKLQNGTNNFSVYAVATDSKGQTGTSGTATVSVSNSIPGCTVSDPRAIASVGFTNQTGTFTSTWTVTPNSAANDTVFGLSPAAASGYSSLSGLLLADVSGVWLAWNNAVTGYAAVNSAPYAAGTTYTFSGTFTFSAGNLVSYDISETSPSSIVIASGYTPRAAATGLAFWNLISSGGFYDTAKVCNFQIGAGTSLTFSPSSLNFGNVTVSSGMPTLTIGVTSAGGASTFSSVAIAGSSDFTISSNTCSGAQTSCSTVIQFAPTATGLETATVTYTDDATGSPQTVNVSGTGIPAASSSVPAPTSLNFGNVQISTSSTAGQILVTLTNGPVTFDATPVTFDNADFSVASNTCVGSVSTPTCQITPKFSPAVLGNEAATLTIHNDAPSGGSTQTVSLIGTSVNFPTPAPATQMVWNGTMPLTIKGKSYSIPISCTCVFATASCVCN